MLRMSQIKEPTYILKYFLCEMEVLDDIAHGIPVY